MPPQRPLVERPALSRRRYRFYAVITLLAPLFLFLFVEGMLRVVRFGPDLHLFREQTINGVDYLYVNPQVSYRYFSGRDFAPVLSPQLFPAHKTKGVFRIFCLGGSTTVGYPYWYNGAFPEFLKERLTAFFPARNFEVINLGITATNSYTVLDIAEDVMDHDPDLLIVYDGHNEFYGALGAASNMTGGLSRSLVRTYLQLIHVKTFLFLRTLFNSTFGWFSSPETVGNRSTLMERVARGKTVEYGSREDRRALEVFAQNLRDLAELCRLHNVPLVLGTQVSNLRQQAPFVSSESTFRDPGLRQRFNEAYNAGMVQYMDGHMAAALDAFQVAQALDTVRADLFFLIARCQDSLRAHGQAHVNYVGARDRDELRFRATTPFNNMILSMDDGDKVAATDIEAAFRTASPDSLIGTSLIWEHLHPNARGAFLMAAAYAQTLRSRGLIASRETWAAADTLNEQRLWEQRAVTPIDEIVAGRKTQILTSGWPFTATEPAVRPVPESDTLGTIAETFVRGTATWEEIHLQAGEYYEHRGESGAAEREYRVILRQIPFSAAAREAMERLTLASKH